MLTARAQALADLWTLEDSILHPVPLALDLVVTKKGSREEVIVPASKVAKTDTLLDVADTPENLGRLIGALAGQGKVSVGLKGQRDIPTVIGGLLLKARGLAVKIEADKDAAEAAES